MKHDRNCRMYIAANCAVGVECPHGYDVCPICDPCSCPGDVPRVAPVLTLAPETPAPAARDGYYFRDERS